MRYALPITDGLVAQHFGHCEHFVLIDVDEESKAIVAKEIVASPGHQPGLLPVWLAEKGVEVLIAGGMGTRAQQLFLQNNIDIVINILEQDPEMAVLSHLEGALATGDNVCDH